MTESTKMTTNKQDSYIAFYKQLPKESHRLDVFDLKGNFVVCGESVRRIVEDFGQTTVEEDASSGVETVAINRSLFDQMLRRYLIEQPEFKIAFYEESFGLWTMRKSGSPGELGGFEEELIGRNEALDTPVVMALASVFRQGQRHVGVAILNKGKREISVNGFTDDEGYRNVECLFMQLGVHECLVSKDKETVDMERLRSVAKMCQVLLIEKFPTAFENKHVIADLGARVQRECMECHRSSLEQPLVRAALSGLIGNVRLSSAMYEIRVQTVGSFMRLNKAAQEALHVFPTSSGEPSTHSLYGWLNRCKTAMGKRGLKTWLRQPLMDAEEIETRLNVVEAFVGDKPLRDGIPSLLRGMPDLSKPLHKLEHKKGTLNDFAQLYTFSRKLSPIARRLFEYRSVHRALIQHRYLAPLEKLIDEHHLKKFEKFWEVAIDVSKLPDAYLLSPRYDEKLMDLSYQMVEAEKALCKVAKNICTDMELTWEKSGKLAWHKSNSGHKRCLKMPSKEEQSRRSKLSSGYVVLDTSKDGIKFTNKELSDVAEELQKLTLLYESIQAALLVQVNEIALSFLEVFEDASALVTEVDILSSFAVMATAATTPYVRPTLLKDTAKEITIKGGRHPLIESQDGHRFVKNDCRMIYGESWLQFITGPNMGGKSTFIRQIGCFVPCDEAILPIRDGIYARVGAGDNQQRGVSTFMAEMLETTAIFHGATERSLVIIDELGRGTSTCDGLGLAWSIANQLMTRIGCPTLFATHFHELTALKHSVGVKNTHVHAEIEASTGRLRMSFKVCDGSCDKSFGIHVARNAGFPSSIIQLAENHLKLLEGDGQ